MVKGEEGSGEWSKNEISLLIKCVFKNGENEWSEITEEIDLLNKTKTGN